MKISIIQFEPNGVPDTDVSIIVPEDGTKFTGLAEEDINEILHSEVKEEIFYEKERGTTMMHTFPALKMNNWYFLWIAQISTWIAIYFYTEPSTDGFNSAVEVDNTIASGPYDIGQDGARLIKEYYKTDIPLEDIKKTSPKKLKN